MSNTTVKVLSLIPETLHPQLFQEVVEALDQQKKEQQKKNQESKEKATPDEINEIVNSIMQ